MKRFTEYSFKPSKAVRLSAISLAALFFSASIPFSGLNSYAATPSDVLPTGGAGVVLGTSNKTSKTDKSVENVISTTEEMEERLAQNAKDAYERLLANLAVADTESYLNIRESADERSEVLGKLYKDGVGEIIGREDGWLLVESGNVTGYVKADNVVTGKAAEEMAPEIGYELAFVNAPTLFVRSEADKDSDVVCVVTSGEEYLVTEKEDGWYKVETASGDGWINEEYATINWQFKLAESREEEQIRLAAESLEKGKELVEYALQFVGNPYVWGGTSLTNGCDCSGFTMSLYKHYGISLSHASDAQRYAGVAVDGLENAQPGDIIIYSGHVAIYMGNNQIVHAANSRLGIVVSGVDFMTVLGIRRIF
jgi:uncharacterized protein YgiM (DUF1202 family)